jgi:hypothetical protein
MFDISSKFKVQIPGRGTLSLGPADHVASGGEGHVYKKSGLAVKMFDDPARAVQGRMTDKIKLLAGLAHPCVVAPEALAVDAGGKAVGLVMPWVDKSWALPLAFTNDWRNQNGFGDKEALSFAARMREVVSFAHGRGAVLGDANELNILGVDAKGGPEPRYIDVDSWGFPGFGGDKVMPSIRDWHSPPFTREADWFAWAVVAFQLLVGIHPYRGTHPAFKRNDLEGRMKANASVFDAAVRTPPAARPLACVPGPLLDWFRAVFADGARDAPPDPCSAPAARRARASFKLVSAAALDVAEVYALSAQALRAAAPDVLLLADGALLSLPDGRRIGRADPAAAFARLADGTIAALRAEGGRLAFGALRAAPGAAMAMLDSGLAATAGWSSENRLFAVVHDGLLEVQVRDLGGRFAAVPGRKWSLNPNATVFGDGLAVWDALGARHLVAPFGAGSVAVLRAKELDGLAPVSIVRKGRVAALSLLDKGGSYKRATVLFAADYASCAVEVEDADDADDGALTDAVTEGGVIVRVDADGKLDLRVPASGARRLVDVDATAFGRLLTGPSGTYCADADRVYKLTLR